MPREVLVAASNQFHACDDPKRVAFPEEEDMRMASLLSAVVVGCFLMSGCAPLSPETRQGLPFSAASDGAGELLPTGVRITPEAAEGARFQPLNPDLPTRPDFVAGQAITTAVSPDGQLLLILTSGFNRNNAPDGKRIPGESNEYVFVYETVGHMPVKRQILQVPNTFNGLAWHPSSQAFYVTGGVDDSVHVFASSHGRRGCGARRALSRWVTPLAMASMYGRWRPVWQSMPAARRCWWRTSRMTR